MSKTQKQTQMHAHECSLSPPLFLVRCCVVCFSFSCSVFVPSVCVFMLHLPVCIVACFRLLSMSMSSVYFLSPLCHLSFFVFELACFCVTNCDNVVRWLCSMLCCVCGSVLVYRVCVCMYVSVGCVCERSHVCWCTTHTLNTRHTHLTHHTHHTHPHGGRVVSCVVLCSVVANNNRHTTPQHITTTTTSTSQHSMTHTQHSMTHTTQHDTQGEEGVCTHQTRPRLFP